MSLPEHIFENFIKMSRLDRKYIVFVKDEEYEKQLKKEQDSIARSLLDSPWYSFLHFMNPVATAVVMTGIIVLSIRSWNRRKLNLVYLPSSVADKFVLPPAESSLNHVYVLDPVIELGYHSFDAYHKYVFERKHMELFRLLVSLGAVKIHEHHIQGWSVEIGAEVGVKAKTQQKSTADYQSKSESMKSVDYAFEKREQEPSIPADLIWYSHEPKWQEYADARINGKCKAMKMQFDYTTDYGVTTKVKKEFKGVGLDVGTSFHRFEKTIWALDVEYD